MIGALKVLERAIAPEMGGMSDALARQVLSMDFPPEDHARVEELSDKARLGTLSESDATDLDDYIAANDLLTILKAKARTSLQQRTPAA
jgi:hypothetical protein